MAHKFKHVKIVWDDAESSDGWEGIPDKLEPKLVTTVGFLIVETDKHVLVAGSVGHGDEDCNNRLQIPKAMILTMETLDERKAEKRPPVVEEKNRRGKNASRHRFLSASKSGKPRHRSDDNG